MSDFRHQHGMKNASQYQAINDGNEKREMDAAQENNKRNVFQQLKNY